MSFNPDTSTWSLATAGGIRYRLMEGYPTGTIENESAEVTEKYIIHKSTLNAFIRESFPPPVEGVFGLLDAPNRIYPGSGELVVRTRRVGWEPFIPGKPADPFSIHPTAPTATYTNFVVVTIDYSTAENKDTDENDPKTYLEIRANASMEFQRVPPRYDYTWPDGTAIKEPDVPFQIVLPETEWSVIWRHVPVVLFDEEIMPLIRARYGKLNDRNMSLLKDAPAETIMFVGFDLEEEFTWRLGEDDFIGPPVTLMYKFQEVHLIVGDDIIGHNHFWRPGAGAGAGGAWEKPVNRLDNLIYAEIDMNELFSPV